jgi:hypothetical protein
MEETIKIGISKYRNDNGISCYVNSILHIMQQLPIFTDYLITGKYLDDLSNNDTNLNDLVIYELILQQMVHCQLENKFLQ